MIVGRGGDGGAEQPPVLVQATDRGNEEHEEHRVLMRRLAWFEKGADFGVADGIIEVLARTVDAAERLLVQEAVKAVPLGDFLQHGHHELVVVDGEVGRFEHRGDLVLARSHFVMVRADRNAELVEFALGLRDAAHDAAGHDAVVLVFKFLPLGRFRAEQRTPGGEQIGTAEHEVPVDEEKFLLQPGVRNDGQGGLLAEQLEDTAGLLVEGLIGAQERGLAVKRHARPRQEGRGDAQHDAAAVFHKVGRAGHVPRGIAARLEGAAQAAGREA